MQRRRCVQYHIQNACTIGQHTFVWINGRITSLLMWKKQQQKREDRTSNFLEWSIHYQNCCWLIISALNFILRHILLLTLTCDADRMWRRCRCLMDSSAYWLCHQSAVTGRDPRPCSTSNCSVATSQTVRWRPLRVWPVSSTCRHLLG